MAPMDKAPTMLDTDFWERQKLEYQAADLQDATKMDKDAAGYREPGKGRGSCSECTFFQRQTASGSLGFCMVVKGVVAGNGKSNLFTDLNGVKQNPNAWEDFQNAGHRPMEVDYPDNPHRSQTDRPEKLIG